MKKDIIDKNESIQAVVRRITADTVDEVVLVVPKYSAMKDSVSNFHLLKKEAAAAGKRVVVESVDEEVLALARESGLEANHPLFKGTSAGAHAFSDIVVSPAAEQNAGEKHRTGPMRHTASAHPGTKKIAPRQALPENKPKTEEEPEAQPQSMPELSKKSSRRRGALPPSDADILRRARRLRLTFIVIVAGTMVAGGAVWGIGRFFSWADLTLHFKRTPWSYQDTLAADKSIAKLDTAKKVLPAELFTQKKNFTQFFPATGFSENSQKAGGTIEIVNAYGAVSQPLVAATRFLTADGRLYRLVNGVTVPAATKKNGTLVPVKITAKVIADRPGMEYNSSTGERLSIPGLKGSPKYDGFYGLLTNVGGGSVGKTVVATDRDVAAATQKMTEVLKSSLQSNLLSGRPEGFVVPEGASNFAITKMTVSRTVDKDGNFGVFSEAAVRAIAFRQEDLDAFLERIANEQSASGTVTPSVLADKEISLANVKPNFDAGRLEFQVAVKGVLAPPFSADNFRAQIAGRDVARVRLEVASLSGLTDAKISVWPFWMSSLPVKVERIRINIP